MNPAHVEAEESQKAAVVINDLFYQFQQGLWLGTQNSLRYLRVFLPGLFLDSRSLVLSLHPAGSLLLLLLLPG